VHTPAGWWNCPIEIYGPVFGWSRWDQNIRWYVIAYYRPVPVVGIDPDFKNDCDHGLMFSVGGIGARLENEYS
jgi:hypothetical protein